jgi:L-aminopeptidase/D-esterase-like protein
MLEDVHVERRIASVSMNPQTFCPGWRVGHYTDAEALTGCTVLLPPPGNVASCDIRGSSPGSRELTSLEVDKKLTEIHAILLTGGSAFGLAAADGVMSWLEERDIGYVTPFGVVPIVPAAVVFDLALGKGDVRPGRREGHLACEAAHDGPVDVGLVGAGTGCSVGKWADPKFAAAGGLGVGNATEEGLTVYALAVVNSVGDVVGSKGEAVAGESYGHPRRDMTLPPNDLEAAGMGNTVLVVVATEAGLEKKEAAWLAGRGSDGVTTSIRPAHTRYDGDVTFAVGTFQPPAGSVDLERARRLDILGMLATEAVTGAIRNAF